MSDPGPPRRLQGPPKDYSSTWKHPPERPWKRAWGPEEAQELSKNALETPEKAPSVKKRFPKLTKGQPGGPWRPKKTDRDMKVGHRASKGAQNQQTSSHKFHLSY